jgi:hypothetical protein
MLHSKAARAVLGKFGALGGRPADVPAAHPVSVRAPNEFCRTPHHHSLTIHTQAHTCVQHGPILWSRFRRDYRFWAAQRGAAHESKTAAPAAFREQPCAQSMDMAGGIRFRGRRMWPGGARGGRNPMAAAGRNRARGAARPARSSVFGGCACGRPSAEGGRTTVKSVLYMWEQWCRRPTLVDIMQPFEAAACEHTLQASQPPAWAPSDASAPDHSGFRIHVGDRETCGRAGGRGARRRHAASMAVASVYDGGMSRRAALHSRVLRRSACMYVGWRV